MTSSIKTRRPVPTPDEVVLQPDDYDLPASAGSATDPMLIEVQEARKTTVHITRKQLQYFGERGVPWADIEKFYNVHRRTLMRLFKADYERGVSTTNIALRSKLVDLALSGNIPALIFTAKNRLNMSDNGVTKDPETDTDLRQRSTEELEALARQLLEASAAKKGAKQ